MVKIIRPEGCICIRFKDTSNYRISDLICPIHGINGEDPGDGHWEVEDE